MLGAPVSHADEHPEAWEARLEALIQAGDCDAFDGLLKNLRLAFPDHQPFAFYRRAVVQIPKAEPWPFRDDTTRNIQVLPRPGATTTLIAFCGHGQHLGIPLGLAHRFLATLGTHLVYVRDPTGSYYVSGIPDVPGDYDDSVVALADILKALGGSRLVCYGNSSGGHAAIRFGLDLGAERVLNMAGASNIRPDFLRRHDLKFDIRALKPDRLHLAVDLRNRLERHRHRPRIHHYYGALNDQDRIQAMNLAGLPDVEPMVIEGCGTHAVVKHLINRRQFAPVLAWLAE